MKLIGLRKNITQGSYWFAIVILSIFGIIRCHLQTQETATFRWASKLDSGKAQDYLNAWQVRQKNAIQWETYYGQKINKKPIKKINAYRKFPDANLRYPNYTEKVLTPKMALQLLLALIKPQKEWTNYTKEQQRKYTGTDSANSILQLKQLLRKQNPYPSQISLNHIDSTTLESFPGIGTGSARRIIQYQKRLGGFVNSKQLFEILKIDTIILQLLEIQCQKSSEPMVYLNENPTWKMLYKHPYIGPERAKIFFSFCQQYPKMSVDEWNRMQGISAIDKDRIFPYLRLQQ